jgi:DNA-binding NarL/FixJ family response regulator
VVTPGPTGSADAGWCPVCAEAATTVAATQDYLADAVEVLESALRLHRRAQEVVARSAALSLRSVPSCGLAGGPAPAAPTGEPTAPHRGTRGVARAHTVRRIRPPAGPRSGGADRELTAREREVLAQVARGCTNRQVARLLGISEKTVKNHLSAVFGKIGVADRTQAALYAIRAGLVPV